VVNKRLISRIKKDFSIVIKNKKILGILLYGSHAQGNATNRSDVDVCVVAPEEDVNQLLSFVLKNVNVNKKKIRCSIVRRVAFIYPNSSN
jgi:predicted nucleotidyltransferase